MNNDLISHSELKKALSSYDKFGYTANRELIRLDNSNIDKFVPYVKFDDVCNCIDNTPAVDINTKLSVAYLKGRRQGQSEERPQGEWKCNNYDEHSCPICGHYALYEEEADGYYEVQSNFCPNCGADMRKGEEE